MRAIFRKNFPLTYDLVSTIFYCSTTVQLYTFTYSQSSALVFVNSDDLLLGCPTLHAARGILTMHEHWSYDVRSQNVFFILIAQAKLVMIFYCTYFTNSFEAHRRITGGQK